MDGNETVWNGPERYRRSRTIQNEVVRNEKIGHGQVTGRSHFFGKKKFVNC